MENEKRVLRSKLGSFICPDTSVLKGKTKKKKTAGSRRGTRRKTAQPGAASSTTAVGVTTARPWLPPRAVVSTTAWPWWPLWWLPSCFPPCAAFWSFGVSPWAAGFSFSWVFWASLQASFDPHGPHFISLDSSQIFLHKSWLES